MKKKTLTFLILLLILIEIIMSGILIFGNTNSNVGICKPGGSCEDVQNSIYGNIFGIKLPVYAIFAFLILFVMFFLNKKTYYVLSTIGFVIALILLFIQFFVLKEICQNCTIIDFSMILIFLFSSILVFNKR